MLEGTVEVASPQLPKMLQAIVAGDSFRQWGIGSETPCGVVSAGEIRVENGTGMAANYDDNDTAGESAVRGQVSKKDEQTI
ncbi:hypothetical protein KSP40_PGU003422 [Platanthera guangdongensis]|uniref:Uncharacterized protein n=1 Tax=Platanthera guangdongensis TaxID=2320717 RepID=A0ABR2MHR8_9ASPA